MKNRLFFFIFLFSMILSACTAGFWSSPSQKYEQEADSLLANGSTSEAILTYHQAAVADPLNHSALKKLIPLYRAQGRNRTADALLSRLTEAERAGLEPADPRGWAQSVTGLKADWVVTPAADEPAGLAADSGSVVVSYAGGQVALLDRTDGKTQWVQSAGEPLTSPPALDQERVIVGSGSGQLTAFDRRSGVKLWSTRLPGAVYAAPVVDDIFAYTGSYGGKVTAVDLVTGEVEWQTDVRDPIVSQPLAAGDVLYAATTGGRIHALERSTGQPVWKDTPGLPGSLEAPLVLEEGRLLAGGNNSRLYALDLNGRDYYWDYSMPDSIYAAPVTRDGRVYVVSAGQKAAALDLLTGIPVWEKDLPVPVRLTPVLKDQLLFVSGQSDLYMLDAETGELLDRVDTGDWIEAGPLLDGDSLILADKDGAVLAYSFK